RAIPSTTNFSCRVFPLSPHSPGGEPEDAPQRHKGHKGRSQPAVARNTGSRIRGAPEHWSGTPRVCLRRVPGLRAFPTEARLPEAEMPPPSLQGGLSRLRIPPGFLGGRISGRRTQGRRSASPHSRSSSPDLSPDVVALARPCPQLQCPYFQARYSSARQLVPLCPLCLCGERSSS